MSALVFCQIVEKYLEDNGVSDPIGRQAFHDTEDCKLAARMHYVGCSERCLKMRLDAALQEIRHG